jgi:phospholipid/cholesterol/gamma-HCH transport system substrate-binding protein
MLELKVGAVLLAALGVLAGFVLLLGDVGLNRGIKVQVDYAFSGSVQPGAPVRISGVKVGRVTEMEFLGGTVKDQDGEPLQVRVILHVEERARSVLRQGARFYVNTQGLIGEHYIEIVPPKEPGPPLAADVPVRGVDPPRYDMLVQRIYDFLGAISRLLDKNEDVLADLLRAGTELARTLDGALKDNKAELADAIRSASTAAKEGAELLAKLNRSVDDKKLSGTVEDVADISARVRKDLPEALKKLSEALDGADKLSRALAGIDKARVDEVVTKASSAIERADKVLADAGAISSKIRSGSGSVGLLIQDDEIYDDLKELLRDLKQHPWKFVWKQ